MNQVVSQMSIARGMAIAQRRSVSVIFTQPNRIQLRRQDQPGGTTDFTPVDFEGGAQFVVFPTVPDTPSGFGNGGAIVFAGINGGPPTMQFQSDGTFADTAGQPINGTIFVGILGQSATARAVTILGATGRVRPYHWTGSQWSE